MTRAILALDPGTLTGWARALELSPGQWQRADSGAWTLLRPDEPPERRPVRLRQALTAAHAANPLALLAFEDVPAAAHRSGKAAHVYGVILGTIQAFAVDNRLELLPVHPSTYKRHTVGLATAGKEQLRAFAHHLWASDPVDPINDDASQDRIDAALLLAYVTTKGLPPSLR